MEFGIWVTLGGMQPKGLGHPAPVTLLFEAHTVPLWGWFCMQPTAFSGGHPLYWSLGNYLPSFQGTWITQHHYGLPH